MQGIPFYEAHCSVHFFAAPLLCLTAVLLLRVIGVYCFVGLAAQSTSFSCQPGGTSTLLVNQRHNQVADISAGIVQVKTCAKQENRKWHADICLRLHKIALIRACMHMDAHVCHFPLTKGNKD